MRKNDDTQVMGYCDANWAGKEIDRKSTTGYCTFVGGNLVTWKSKKQSVIARTAEAEYRSMASAACEPSAPALCASISPVSSSHTTIFPLTESFSRQPC